MPKAKGVKDKVKRPKWEIMSTNCNKELEAVNHDGCYKYEVGQSKKLGWVSGVQIS